MKELSIEQKAKRYDKAIERARNLYNSEETSAEVEITCENIFPELKESEVGRIRKALIRFHKNTIEIDGIKGEDIIAWLEKQGEKDVRQKFLEDLLVADDIYQMSVNDTMVEEAKSKAINALCKLEIGKLLGLEKQGEQRTADKVEPKFQNGQWIVWQNQCYKVNFLNGRGYELILQNGIITSIEYGAVDKSAHLWTISEAKDGDVLVASDNSIFIFSHCIDNACVHHIALEVEDNVVNINDKLERCWETIRGVCPATQEQRYLLFQKLKDADYEWDSVKKELKKIE